MQHDANTESSIPSIGNPVQSSETMCNSLGLELEIRCALQLSYRRIKEIRLGSRWSVTGSFDIGTGTIVFRDVGAQ